MARKKKRGLENVLYVRVSPDLLKRLDAIVDRERAEQPGRVVSRADVARVLLYRATEPA
jgi:hypothetical protein